MGTATLERPASKSRPSLVDELHRVADWIREHDAAQDVALVMFPPGSRPDRPFKVVFSTVAALRRLLPGRAAERTRVRGEISYLTSLDDIQFQANEYAPERSEPVVDEITL